MHVRMLRIAETPPAERPRERCLNQGPRCLSLRECIALILGSGPPGLGSLGVASGLLERPGAGLSGEDEERALFTAMEVSSGAHLKNLPGLGDAGQARLLAAFELCRRYALFRERVHVKPRLARSRLAPSRQALFQVDPTLRCEAQEWLGFVPLYRTGELGELCIVERGVRTHVNVDPAELFARILALRPQAITLFHNHPSGSLLPSDADFNLTRHVGRLAGQLGIRLLGHWILTARGEHWIDPEAELGRGLT